MNDQKTIKCSFGVPPESAPIDFMRVDQVAKSLGISQDTLRDWNKIGLPFYHIGKPAFCRISEVNRFFENTATVRVGKQEKGKE